MISSFYLYFLLIASHFYFIFYLFVYYIFFYLIKYFFLLIVHSNSLPNTRGG